MFMSYCPECGLGTSIDNRVCECGYEFLTDPAVLPRRPESRRHPVLIHVAANVGKYLLLTLGSTFLLGLMAAFSGSTLLHLVRDLTFLVGIALSVTRLRIPLEMETKRPAVTVEPRKA